METKKAIGQRGSWFVTVDGEELPCMHKHWLNGLEYHDPFSRHKDETNLKRLEELAKAIETLRKIVLSDDQPTFDANGDVVAFKRTEYIAVFAVSGVSYSRNDGLRFTITERIANLK